MRLHVHVRALVHVHEQDVLIVTDPCSCKNMSIT